MAKPNPKEFPPAPWFRAAGDPGANFPRANPAGWTWLEDTPPGYGTQPQNFKPIFDRKGHGLGQPGSPQAPATEYPYKCAGAFLSND
jgi:hypothetical protein